MTQRHAPTASSQPAVRAIRGGVTAPRGFLAAGVHAGIKKRPLLDLALVVSEREGPVAGLFTRNHVAAAPVVLDRQHLRHGRGRAIVVNSGNANACTGARGLADAREMADLVARALDVDRRTVYVGSTGVIGRVLPIARIRRAVPALVAGLTRRGGRQAAQAILTTDLKVKEAAFQARIGGRLVTVGGMAKGSGMIHPDMATMLAYLTTDAAIERSTLQGALAAAVDTSFNCISVDGDTSTNDTVLCLANGLAGNPPLRRGSRELPTFQRLLERTCHELAMQVCRDGEGVTKVVEIAVTGARTRAEAKQVARTVGTSSLVKTALFGEDANWGRILAAVGRAGVPVNPDRITVAYAGVPIYRAGAGLGPAAERRLDRIVRRREFTITIDLGQGSGTFRLWTTDLSYDYVRINAAYRT
ncbi:bifunctional glutamate N-acetyltransferase/amino-acid acetyltransferase ArgJ [Nitrospira sp. Kam-Ns4a]